MKARTAVVAMVFFAGLMVSSAYVEAQDNCGDGTAGWFNTSVPNSHYLWGAEKHDPPEGFAFVPRDSERIGVAVEPAGWNRRGITHIAYWTRDPGEPNEFWWYLMYTADVSAPGVFASPQVLWSYYDSPTLSTTTASVAASLYPNGTGGWNLGVAWSMSSHDGIQWHHEVRYREATGLPKVWGNTEIATNFTDVVGMYDQLSVAFEDHAGTFVPAFLLGYCYMYIDNGVPKYAAKVRYMSRIDVQSGGPSTAWPVQPLIIEEWLPGNVHDVSLVMDYNEPDPLYQARVAYTKQIGSSHEVMLWNQYTAWTTIWGNPDPPRQVKPIAEGPLGTEQLSMDIDTATNPSTLYIAYEDGKSIRLVNGDGFTWGSPVTVDTRPYSNEMITLGSLRLFSCGSIIKPGVAYRYHDDSVFEVDRSVVFWMDGTQYQPLTDFGFCQALKYRSDNWRPVVNQDPHSGRPIIAASRKSCDSAPLLGGMVGVVTVAPLVRVRVVDDDTGVPIIDATVTLYDAVTGVQIDQVTEGNDGYYDFADFDFPRRVSTIASHPDYEVRSAIFDVTQDCEMESAVIQMEPRKSNCGLTAVHPGTPILVRAWTAMIPLVPAALALAFWLVMRRARHESM